MERTYFSSGILKSEGFFFDGKKEGCHKVYYPSGNLHIVYNYVNDIANFIHI